MATLSASVECVRDLADAEMSRLIQRPAQDAEKLASYKKAVWSVKVLSSALSVVSNRKQFAGLPIAEQWSVVTSLQPFVNHLEIKAFLKSVVEDDLLSSDVREIARTVLRGKSGRSGARRNLVWLTGWLNRIDNDVKIAYATLHDEHRQEYVGEFALRKITEAGLKEGDGFMCVVVEKEDKTTVTLLPRQKRELSQEELRETSEKIAKAAAALGCGDAFPPPSGGANP